MTTPAFENASLQREMRASVLTRGGQRSADERLRYASTPTSDAALARRLAEARLRFLAPILIAAIAALCLRDLAIGGRTLTALELALAAGATVAALGLFLPGLPVRAIALVEIALVWLAGGYLAARTFDPRTWVDGAADLVTMRHLDHAAVTLGLLIIAYAIAVPNEPRRAAAVCAPLALAPLAAAIIRLSQDSSLLEVPGLSAMLITDALIIPGAVTALAIYGTYRLHSYELRLERARDEGRYHLERLVGEGGMGHVWLARHYLLSRPVAVKTIRATQLGDPTKLRTAWRRFEQEAQAIAALRSPHTVELYDFGITADDTFYYVMEYLPGLDLQKLVERHGRLGADRAIYLLRQACDALEEAHGLGLVHRDIKPSNLVVCKLGTEYDFVKVLDFGLAKSFSAVEPDALTADDVFVGTPAYAAPEVIRGRALGPPADIYSLGCVAFWMLTGEQVFPATTAAELLVAHLNEEPAPPSSSGVWVPEPLDAVVTRCLAKEPGDRFGDAAELRAALNYCATGRPWSRDRAREWWNLNKLRRDEMGGPIAAERAASEFVPRDTASDKSPETGAPVLE